ncbi:hypothetical protein [Aureispira anguillae]|nr:hypothetical protein [Aureispira anguillae]
MKSLTILLSTLLFFALFSCGDSSESATQEPEVKSLNCSDLDDQYLDWEGKEVTIKAISWGTSNTASGDIYLNLGDEVLSGMKQPKVIAVFPADQEATAKGAAKDSEVTIKATVKESKYGAIYLANPSIL